MQRHNCRKAIFHCENCLERWTKSIKGLTPRERGSIRDARDIISYLKARNAQNQPETINFPNNNKKPREKGRKGGGALVQPPRDTTEYSVHNGLSDQINKEIASSDLHIILSAFEEGGCAQLNKLQPLVEFKGRIQPT